MHSLCSRPTAVQASQRLFLRVFSKAKSGCLVLAIFNLNTAQAVCCLHHSSLSSVLMPCLSLLEHDAGTLEGAPNTLGYPSPEVTALGHSQQPSSPLDLHKDDVWAVGVMGLLWLSKRQNMPFGPTRQQAKRLASPQGLAEAKKSVLAQHDAWVSLSSLLRSQLILHMAYHLFLP